LIGWSLIKYNTPGWVRKLNAAIIIFGAGLMLNTSVLIPSQVKTINFKDIKRRNRPNEYLVCPKDFCRRAIPDELSETYDVSSGELFTWFISLIESMPRTTILSKRNRHLVVEFRSKLFQFSDLVDVLVIPVEADRSTLAIYSRSKLGYYDFNANQKRVKELLRRLDKYF
jgi:hypothetical protein